MRIGSQQQPGRIDEPEMGRAEIHVIERVERVVRSQDPVDRRQLFPNHTRKNIRGRNLHVVHEVGDVACAEGEEVEAMKQVGAVIRSSPSRDLRGGSDCVHVGAEIERSARGGCDVRHDWNWDLGLTECERTEKE